VALQGGARERIPAPVIADVRSAKSVDVIKVFDETPKELPFTGSYLKLKAWDNGGVDGDRISIMVNGKYCLKNYTLDSIPKVVEMRLPDKEVDTIAVIALNEGTSPPNTAMIVIASLSEQYSVEMRARQNEVRIIYLRRKK
jgi:hypothetical protein